MDTETARTLAAYRTSLIAEGLPEHVADAVTLSAADALHGRAVAPERPATPPGVDGDDYTPEELEQRIAQRRALRGGMARAI